MNVTYRFPEDGIGPMIWILGAIVVLMLMVYAFTFWMAIWMEGELE